LQLLRQENLLEKLLVSKDKFFYESLFDAIDAQRKIKVAVIVAGSIASIPFRQTEGQRNPYRTT
jgi:hypothetical protein